MTDIAHAQTRPTAGVDLWEDVPITKDGPGRQCANTDAGSWASPISNFGSSDRLVSSLPQAQPTSVYRYYDDAHLLLYVGITSRGAARNMEHNHSKEWWRFVDHQRVEHFPTRDLALARERELILEYRPPFNKQHNIDHEQARAAYLAWGETPAEDRRSAAEVFAELNRNMPLEPLLIGERRTILRSRLQDFPLARSIEFTPNVMLLAPKKVGIVDSITQRGVFLLVTIEGAPRDGFLPPLVARVRVVSLRSERYRISVIEGSHDGP